MQELIKYFETIETRLAALESKEQELKSWEERLCKTEKAQQDNLVKLQAVGANIATMLQTLKTLETKQSEAAHVAAPVAMPEPVVVEKVVEPTPEPVVVEKVVEPTPEPVVVEKVVEPTPEPVVVEKVVEPTPEPVVAEKVVEPTPEPVVVEKVVEPTPEPVETPKAALYGKPVDDIRLAISLGDRFLYQRELFGQNAELMQRTLGELNELASFDEAMSYISTHFEWDADTNTYQQFIVTLHRRFG